MTLIDTILQRKEFESNLPVLVDVGASGELHAKWKKIAPYAICIAFDADEREMGFVEKESKTYRKLIVFNRVVTDKAESEIDFHLTRSPFCSSTLRPDLNQLSYWSFQQLFETEKTIKLGAIRLEKALKEANITRIDWLKTDTQGTDLRLFSSLPDAIRQQVLAAEFEPGILDAYQGEDKLWSLMQFFDQGSFFMSSLEIKGTQRISPVALQQFSPLHRKALQRCLTISPGWGETTYLNTLPAEQAFDQRAHLLAFVFALTEKQYGFALEIAGKGFQRFSDPFFEELQHRMIHQLKVNNLKWPLILLQRKLNKLFQYLNA